MWQERSRLCAATYSFFLYVSPVLMISLRSRISPAHQLADGAGLRVGQEKADTLVRAFYAFLAMEAFIWNSWASTRLFEKKALPARMHLDWSGLIPREEWGSVVFITSLAAFLGACLLVFQPGHRWARRVVALATITYWAIRFDAHGKVDHALHLSFWASIVLVFLPTRPKVSSEKSSEENESGALREYRILFLRVFYYAQVWIASFYTCAGLSKLLGVVYDYREGATWFHRDAMALTLSAHWAQAKSAPLAPFFVLHPGWGQLANFGALALELLALPVVLHGRFLRLWGIGLVGMHFMILQSMKIHFHHSVIVLLLFLVASPLPIAARGEASTASLLPDSKWKRIGAMGVLGLYLAIGFTRFRPAQGKFEEDLFPFSVHSMFWRIPDDAGNVRHLAALRKKLKSKRSASE